MDEITTTNIAPERRAELLEIIRNFRLMDDTFMSKVFEDKECAELLLRVEIGKRLVIEEDHPQCVVGIEHDLLAYGVGSVRAILRDYAKQDGACIVYGEV